jgi:hypothetical protein
MSPRFFSFVLLITVVSTNDVSQQEIDSYIEQIQPVHLDFGRTRLSWLDEEHTPKDALNIEKQTWDSGRPPIPRIRYWWTEIDTTVTQNPIGVRFYTHINVVNDLILSTPNLPILYRHFILQTRICVNVDVAFPSSRTAFFSGSFKFLSVVEEGSHGFLCSTWAGRRPGDYRTQGEHWNSFLPRYLGKLTLQLEARVCARRTTNFELREFHDGDDVSFNEEKCTSVQQADLVHLDITTPEQVILDVMSAPPSSIDVVNGFSEFTFEMAITVPYAFYLHSLGKLKSVTSFENMRECCYYFVDHFIPVSNNTLRAYSAIGLSTHGGINPTSFKNTLDFRMWAPPPFREIFQQQASEVIFPWEVEEKTKTKTKPLMIIHNKATDGIFIDFQTTARMPMLSASCLKEMFETYSAKYTMVYFGKVAKGAHGYGKDTGEYFNVTARTGRNNHRDATNMSVEIRLSEINQVLMMNPEIYQFNTLLDKYSNIGYNKLQFLLHAQSQHFVSCTGGSAVIASYFGGTNIVVTNYKDPTRAVGGYFSAFANTNVVLVQYEKDLLEKMNELF